MSAYAWGLIVAGILFIGGFGFAWWWTGRDDGGEQ